MTFVVLQIVSDLISMRRSLQPLMAKRNIFKYGVKKKKPTPYRYSSLNEDRGEIRLLTLHEGSFKADVEISIHTLALTSVNPPIYEALSYFWGSTKNMVDIKTGNNRLAVTQELAIALPYLRYKDRPRTLWIDAICINQLDLKERSRQVKRMADIYKLADRVIAWLGRETERSTLGMKILEDLSSKIKIDQRRQVMEPASPDVEKHWSDRSRTLPSRWQEIKAIDAVIKHAWFGRLWAQQEIRLAERDPILICGPHHIAWKSFCRAILYLHIKSQSAKIKWAFLHDAVDKLYDLVIERSKFRFLDIMSTTRSCGCRDPKDRVYAVLSLLQEDEALGIEPDYEKTTSHIYQDVALRHITHHKRTDILGFSGLRGKECRMPTWVPDWTVSVADKALPFEGLASGYSVSKYHYEATDILGVTGSHSATVQSASNMKCSTHETMIAEIRRHVSLNALGDSYVAGGSLLEAYCKTMCANRFRDTCLRPRQDRPYFPQSKDILLEILQPTTQRALDYSVGTEAEKFLNSALIHCRGASLIKTREGYIGLAPRSTRPGDQVCILLGCNWPLLLRPAPDSRYQVVGICYIDGLMYGEAFLGPLPEPYQAVSIFDEASGSHSTGFLDHQARKVQYNDPRLGSPMEGQVDQAGPRERHPDGSSSRRLTADILEERGVILQNFDLI